MFTVEPEVIFKELEGVKFIKEDTVVELFVVVDLKIL